MNLRQLEREDLPQLRDWRNSDWLRPYVREYRLLNMENQEEWFRSLSSRDVEMFGIELAGVLIGVCGLTHINWVNRTAEISIYVARGARGYGVGSEALERLEEIAFDRYNLNRIWAEIYDHNEASIKLFEKAGYLLEGRMRQHVYKEGAWRDSLLYGRLRCDR